MTPEEKRDFKEYIHSAIAGYVSRVESQNEITNLKLSNIDTLLTKQNGRIGKAEEAIAMALQERSANRQKQENYFMQIDDLDERLDAIEKKEATHAITCPNITAIRVLQDEALSNKSVKKFMGAMFVGGIALGGFVVGLLKLIMG